MGNPIPGSAKCKGLYDLFVPMFPQYEGMVRLYGPYDRQSIKLDFYDHRSYIFNYVDDRNWGFQTFKNHLEASGGRK